MKRCSKTAIAFLALILLLLNGCGSARGRTVRCGDYTIRTEKTTEEASPQEDQLPERGPITEDMRDYVLNKNSKKFHDPSCPGAAEIKETNRWEYHGTRQSVLDMGYVPCRICNP